MARGLEMDFILFRDARVVTLWVLYLDFLAPNGSLCHGCVTRWAPFWHLQLIPDEDEVEAIYVARLSSDSSKTPRPSNAKGPAHSSIQNTLRSTSSALVGSPSDTAFENAFSDRARHPTRIPIPTLAPSAKPVS